MPPLEPDNQHFWLEFLFSESVDDYMRFDPTADLHRLVTHAATLPG